MIRKLLILTLLLVLQKTVFAQNVDCSIPNAARNKKYLPAVLIDSTLLKKDLRNKLNFKKIGIKLLEQKVTGFYGYTFKVNKDGIVVPVSYATTENRISNKNADNGEVDSFFKTYFNKYRWKPGHEIKNESNLSPYCLQLSIFFENSRSVKIFIRELRADEQNFVFYNTILLH